MRHGKEDRIPEGADTCVILRSSKGKGQGDAAGDTGGTHQTVCESRKSFLSTCPEKIGI